MQAVHEAALAYSLAGLSVLPIMPDGTKSPDSRALPRGMWSPFQNRIASADEIGGWFDGRPKDGLAIIGGKVSGNLEIMDFDDPTAYDEWMAAIEEHGWSKHVERLPLVQTPSGGYHLYYRCTTAIDGNRKLAYSADRKIRIETRGEHGYVLAPPTPAICHPDNKPYLMMRCALTGIPQITPEQRNVLLALAEVLNEYVEPGSVIGGTLPRPSGTGLRPGEDYNERGDYEGLLERRGWTRGRVVAGKQIWCRPGKNKGLSATTGFKGKKMFHCFTSNGAPFDIDKNYSPFGVYAMLEHNGDYSTAARELGMDGYGEKYTPTPTRWQRPGQAPIAKPGDDWEDIVLFDETKLTPFPIEALPDAIRWYVREVAESVQVPIDLVGMTAIAAAGAATRGRCYVQIGDTHGEPTNLYMLGVMPPASRKSDVLELITAPLFHAEYRLRELAEGKVNAAKQRFAAEQAHLASLKSRAGKAESDWQREQLIEEMDLCAATMTDPPELPTLMVDDVTVEALATRMSEQEDESMAVVSAEGIFFENIAGRYADGKPNLDLVLKAHRGEMCKVDRQSRSTVVLAKPSLSLCILIQPHVVDEFRSVRAFKGRGLLARFLYVYPPELGFRAYINRGVDRLARDSYHDAVNALLEIPNASDKLQPRRRHHLNIRGDALTEWIALYSDIEARMQEGGDLAGVRDWAGKLPGQAARIAGIFHLIKHTNLQVAKDTPISADSMVEAWSIVEYLIPQALFTFGEMSAPADYLSARRILEWVEKKKPEHFTKRQVFAAIKRKGVVYEDIDKGAAVLCQHGYLRLEEVEAKAKGRTPEPRFAVHPELIGGESDGS